MTWHLAKHKDKFDCVLAQVTEIYSVDDISNQKRQKRAVLIFEVGNTTKESQLECNKAIK